MIVSSTRIVRTGGIDRLRRHLLEKPDDNEIIEVIAGTPSAFDDAHLLANVRGCRYSVRHISISPENEMSSSQLGEFVSMIDREFAIGTDRPRLVVWHRKNGRSHFHLVISEVDPVSQRVLDCRNDYARLEKLARTYERRNNETILPSPQAVISPSNAHRPMPSLVIRIT